MVGFFLGDAFLVAGAAFFDAGADFFTAEADFFTAVFLVVLAGAVFLVVEAALVLAVVALGALVALVVFLVLLADLAAVDFAFFAAGDFFSSSLALGVAFFLEVDLIRLFFPIDNPFEIGCVLAYSANLQIKEDL